MSLEPGEPAGMAPAGGEEMTRCVSFWNKFEEEGNFCGMSPQSISQVKAYLEIAKKIEKTGIDKETIYLNFPEGAARPLISVKDDETRTKGLNHVVSVLKKGQKINGKELQKTINTWLTDNTTDCSLNARSEKLTNVKRSPTVSTGTPTEPEKLPASPFIPPPKSIPVTDAPPQPSLAEQMRAPPKPLPGSWITAPPKNIEEVRKAEREELENRAEALLELMPKSTQLTVTDLLREHPSWKVKDAFYYGIECLGNKVVRK